MAAISRHTHCVPGYWLAPIRPSQSRYFVSQNTRDFFYIFIHTKLLLSQCEQWNNGSTCSGHLNELFGSSLNTYASEPTIDAEVSETGDLIDIRFKKSIFMGDKEEHYIRQFVFDKATGDLLRSEETSE